MCDSRSSFYLVGQSHDILSSVCLEAVHLFNAMRNRFHLEAIIAFKDGSWSSEVICKSNVVEYVGMMSSYFIIRYLFSSNDILQNRYLSCPYIQVPDIFGY